MSGGRLAVHATTADPDVIEICAGAGAKAYFVDLEHGPCGIRESIEAVRVAQAVGLEAHFRLSLAAIGLASRLADAGADGVHFADVRRPQDVETAVRALFHPPLGSRGYGGCRRNGYAAPAGPPETSPVLGVQIESREALARLGEILSCPGVGLVSVGTRDLAADLGHVDLEHPELREALEFVTKTAHASGIEVATMVRSPHQPVTTGTSLVLVPLASLLRQALASYLEGPALGGSC